MPYTSIFKFLKFQEFDLLSQEEYDEIDELRRFSMEIQNPEPETYTTT